MQKKLLSVAIAAALGISGTTYAAENPAGTTTPKPTPAAITATDTAGKTQAEKLTVADVLAKATSLAFNKMTTEKAIKKGLTEIEEQQLFNQFLLAELQKLAKENSITLPPATGNQSNAQQAQETGNTILDGIIAASSALQNRELRGLTSDQQGQHSIRKMLVSQFPDLAKGTVTAETLNIEVLRKLYTHYKEMGGGSGGVKTAADALLADGKDPREAAQIVNRQKEPLRDYYTKIYNDLNEAGFAPEGAKTKAEVAAEEGRRKEMKVLGKVFVFLEPNGRVTYRITNNNGHGLQSVKSTGIDTGKGQINITTKRGKSYFANYTKTKDDKSGLITLEGDFGEQIRPTTILSVPTPFAVDPLYFVEGSNSGEKGSGLQPQDDANDLNGWFQQHGHGASKKAPKKEPKPKVVVKWRTKKEVIYRDNHDAVAKAREEERSKAKKEKSTICRQFTNGLLGDKTPEECYGS